MSLVSRKEFAILCDKSIAIINVNVGRGKIIVRDKKIDTENAFNKMFFDNCHKQKVFKKKPEPKIEELYKEVVEVKKPIDYSAPEYGHTKKETAKQKRERKKQNEKDKEIVDWDVRKKKAEALLKERQAEKELINIKQKYGEMIPTEFVKIMFTTFTKSMLSIFDNSMMNLAGVYCDELAGGDREALSRVNQKLNEEFQDIINSASEIATKDLMNEIKSFSIKRGKGEKING